MNNLSGVGVALATPLNNDYSIDYSGLERLIKHVSNGGVDYLVIQGTTGESPVFSWKEKLQILEFVMEKNEKKLPVVIGLGGNNTFDLIEKSSDLKSFHLAGILSASPYYSKPSQKGIIRHYEMLADAYPHPIILYNVPSRTASNMKAETTLKLAEHTNIIAMKEASGDLEQCRRISENRPNDFLLLSGDDTLTLELIKMGADGVISVIANAMPAAFEKMVEAALEGQMDQAIQLDVALQKAYQQSMKEGNPSSIKAALEALCICSRVVKPPLFDASDELVNEWRQLLN